MTEHLLVGEFLLLFGHQACSGQSFLRVDTLEPPSVFWGRFLLHGRLQPRVGNSSLAGQRCPLLPALRQLWLCRPKGFKKWELTTKRSSTGGLCLPRGCGTAHEHTTSPVLMVIGQPPPSSSSDDDGTPPVLSLMTSFLPPSLPRVPCPPEARCCPYPG